MTSDIRSLYDGLFSNEYPFNTNEGKLMRSILYSVIVLMGLQIINWVTFPR
jgi:hypothetical protein